MEIFFLYLYNLQGDITKIVDEDGNVVVEYYYDAWGNIVDQTDNDLAKINPYRYRGYRYDDETGWYYLNSRYYNPEIGRFINADGLIGKTGDLLGHNIYAYCKNNPIMYYDPSGYFSLSLSFFAGAKIAAAISAVAPFVLPALAVVATVALVAYVVVNYDEIEAGFKNKIGVYTNSNSSDLPSQGAVDAGVEGAPAVDAGKQGKHVKGHPNYKEDGTSWPDGTTGVKETQEAWVKGKTLNPDKKGQPGEKRQYDFGQDGGKVRVHIDSKGLIHGHPVR